MVQSLPFVSKIINGKLLFKFAHEGNCDGIALLLDQGADIEVTDEDGWTSLIWAACNGCCDAVELLLDRGANIEAVDGRGCTSLILTASSTYGKAVQLLLDRGANINAVNNNGHTALIYANQVRNTDISKLIQDEIHKREAQPNM